jgi:hypothetical protein
MNLLFIFTALLYAKAVPRPGYPAFSVKMAVMFQKITVSPSFCTSKHFKMSLQPFTKTAFSAQKRHFLIFRPVVSVVNLYNGNCPVLLSLYDF